MEPVIEARGLRKSFRVTERPPGGPRSLARRLLRPVHREVVAVHGLDLTVRPGEIRALIGPNGAGKSTSIKMMSGVLHPSSGEVRCLGMVPWRDRPRYVRQIGAMFGQKSQLHWDLPAADTFALNRRLYRIAPETYRRNLEYFVDTFQLAGIMSKPVRNLSLGERMKCELTATLLHDPPLLFLDEPTIGLDLLAKDAVRTFIKQVNRERGVTILLTTHDLDDVEDLCERVTVINHGTVVFDRTLDELRGGFSDEKLLHLRFRRTVAAAELAAWPVVHAEGVEALLKLSAADDFPAQVASVLAALPVQDLEIRNPDIDSVVRDAYLRLPTISVQS